VGFVFYFFGSGYLLVFDLFDFRGVFLSLIFFMDFSSVLFLGVVGVVFSMVLVFRVYYYVGDGGFVLIMFLMLMFFFFILVYIVRLSLLVVLFGWDMVGVVSFFLIIYYNNEVSYMGSFVVIFINRLGDLVLLFMLIYCLLVGDLLFFFYYDYFVFGLLFFLLVGFTKSLQFPFFY
jgi:NADH-ubiquinone oxidoreductase chain 5